MKLALPQLTEHLQREILPVYFISGDEPFQKDQALNQIRTAAVDAGFTERQVYHVDRNFDWTQLQQQASSMSLFAEKKIIELRMRSNKPGDGAKALVTYCEAIPDDTVLIIVSPKLEPAQQKAKWFNAITQVGAGLAVWPIDRRELPQWATRRMQQRGLQPDAQALSLFCDRIEGNLLAADQEIEKLLLLSGAGEVSAEDIVELVTDSARYDVFNLVDTALLGDVEHSVKMMHGLKDEGQEVVLISWALAREIRQLISMARVVEEGKRLQAVCEQYRVWPKRRAAVLAALQRGNSGFWADRLQDCAQLDRVIKGQKMGNRWHELLQLLLQIAENPAGLKAG